MNMMKPEELDHQLLELFTQEARERSSDIERTLLALEDADGVDTKRRLQEQLLRMAHSLKGAAGLVQVRAVESICHWIEELLSVAAKEERVLDRSEVDLFLAAADAITDAVRLLESGDKPSSKHAENVLFQLEAAITRQTERDGEGTGSHRSRAEGQVPVRVSDTDGSMRVSADRLDALLYRSGELLAWNAVVRRHAEEASRLRQQTRKLRARGSNSAAEAASIENGLRALAASLNHDGRLMHSSTTALENEVRRARTQPFAEACKGLARIVRDMAASSGKLAELEVRGGEIEIDRSILAGLQDSLRHLVRNAIAHGIQEPAKRRMAGKPEKGRIVVAASISGDRVQVLVEDDGRGLDTASLRSAAGKADLQQPEDERQLLRQIFEPGVSTSTAVTKLSGRGIGLDIVRTAVEGMRGAADVSQVSGGGAAITLTLPLTLATVRALEVIVGGHVFAIDTASVQSVIRVSAKDIATSAEKRVVTTRAGPIPLIDLARWLGLQSASRRTSMEFMPAVIVGAAGREAAVLVDEVAGEQELLVRSLGPRLAKVRRYNGGIVLPDGRIALLLNAAALAEAATEKNPGTDALIRPVAPRENRKVLVVDDSVYVRSLIRLILEGAGYEVAMIADGGEAWEHLRQYGADIVIADVDMPSMNGFALTQTIRESGDFPDMPVILVTGRETPEDKVRGLHAGANAYLTKNEFDSHQFLETVRQFV